MTERHGHVRRSPLRERDPRHARRLLGPFEGAAVLDLQADKQFAVRVQGPGIGALQVLVRRDTPDPCGRDLAAGPAPSAPEAELHGLDEGFDGLRGLGVAQQQTVHAAGEQLAHLPRVRAHDVGGGALDGQFDDHGGHRVGCRGVAMAGGKALHEAVEPGQVEGTVLHANVDVICPGPRGGTACFEAEFGAGVAAGVEDGLPGGQSGHCTVSAGHGRVDPAREASSASKSGFT